MSLAVTLGEEVQLRASSSLPPTSVVAYVRREGRPPSLIDVDTEDPTTFTAAFTPSATGSLGANKGVAQGTVRDPGLPASGGPTALGSAAGAPCGRLRRSAGCGGFWAPADAPAAR